MGCLMFDSTTFLYIMVAVAVLFTAVFVTMNIVKMIQRFKAGNVDLSTGKGKAIVLLEAIAIAGYLFFIAIFICLFLPGFTRSNSMMALMFIGFLAAVLANGIIEKLMH
jgi:hypothetical protein